MKRSSKKVVGIAAVAWLLASAPTAAQPRNTRGAVSLPVAGTFAEGGEFKGTISINRFEQRGTAIVAIGFTSGVLSRGGQALGTAFAGEIVWPVVVRSGGLSTAVHQGDAGSSGSTLSQQPPLRPASAVVPAQGAGCPVLAIQLGPHAVDLLGFQVALDPVVLDISGAPGTPLGELVCAASELLTNVARLVNVLNGILSLLTGLLGGLVPGGLLPVGLVAAIG